MPADSHAEALPDNAAAFWEERYRGSASVWSGRVNRTLADVVSTLRPGRALDLGCGEGGDVLWLAQQGWWAAGLDVSATAVARGRAAAVRNGLAERAHFFAADLAEWAEDPAGTEARGLMDVDAGGDAVVDAGVAAWDLITASFLQSPVGLPRGEVLRAACARVAFGGRIVLISHAARPPWGTVHRGPREYPSPESELALLSLDDAEWFVEAAEVRTRHVQAPDGAPSSLDDTVIVARRLTV